MRNFLVSSFLALLIISCNQVDSYQPEVNTYPIQSEEFNGSVQFQKSKSTQGFKVLLKDLDNRTVDQAVFKYIPYHFDTADVDRDGKTEVLIGLIKKTEFDPQEKKRLFILRVDNGQLRPLWLGSKVCQELIDFKSSSNGIIQTIERTSNNTYSIGDYYWESFGLTLRNYTHNEISLHEALQIFQRPN